ncbi:uncharacterized protein LOC110477800 [Lonchura striata]
MMVFRQIPNLILINWMQDFDQHEKNRHCGSRQHPRPVEELSRRTSGGKYSQCHAAAGGSGTGTGACGGPARWKVLYRNQEDLTAGANPKTAPPATTVCSGPEKKWKRWG